MENNLVIKSKGKRGTRSVQSCKNCGRLFSELNIKIRAGHGKFCSNECYKAFRKKHKKDEKEANRMYQKKHKYGLTVEEYNRIAEGQQNKCLICGAQFSDENRIHVDHDHNTGVVRGMLCRSCNTLLGMAKDDVNILKNAIEYLNNASEKSNNREATDK